MPKRKASQAAKLAGSNATSKRKSTAAASTNTRATKKAKLTDYSAAGGPDNDNGIKSDIVTRSRRTSTRSAQLSDQISPTRASTRSRRQSQRSTVADDALTPSDDADEYTNDFMMSYIDDQDEPVSAVAPKSARPKVKPHSKSKPKEQERRSIDPLHVAAATMPQRRTSEPDAKLDPYQSDDLEIDEKRSTPAGHAQPDGPISEAVSVEMETGAQAPAVHAQSERPPFGTVSVEVETNTQAPTVNADPTVVNSLTHHHETPAIIDDQATIIRKLSHAVHALGNLNIPSPARPLISHEEIAGMSNSAGVSLQETDMSRCQTCICPFRCRRCRRPRRVQR